VNYFEASSSNSLAREVDEFRECVRLSDDHHIRSEAHDGDCIGLWGSSARPIGWCGEARSNMGASDSTDRLERLGRNQNWAQGRRPAVLDTSWGNVSTTRRQSRWRSSCSSVWRNDQGLVRYPRAHENVALVSQVVDSFHKGINKIGRGKIRDTGAVDTRGDSLKVATWP